MPIDSLACSQNLRKFDRRSRPPFGPMKPRPLGLGSANRSRWSASSGTISTGNETGESRRATRCPVD